MDIGLLRGLLTVALLILFIGLWLWSWSNNRTAEFNAAAHRPLEDDELRPEVRQDMEKDDE